MSLRQKMVVALSAVMLISFVVAGPAHTETGDQRPCMTKGERDRLQVGMTMARTFRIIDSSGRKVDAVASQRPRQSRLCWTRKYTYVAFYERGKGAWRYLGPAMGRVDEQRAIYETDQRVFNGTSGPDVITGTRASDRIYGRAGRDSIGPRRGRDKVFAGRGPDYVFVRRDHLRDVIDCGPGKDRAHFLPPRDKKDVFRSCKVAPYSP
jgi:hypothetical protein